MPLVPMRRGGQKVHQLRPMPRPALRNVPSHAGPQQYRRGPPALTQGKGGQAQGTGLNTGFYHETIMSQGDPASFGAIFSVAVITFLLQSWPRWQGIQPGAGRAAGN